MRDLALVLLLVLGASPSPAFADLLRYVDGNGISHFATNATAATASTAARPHRRSRGLRGSADVTDLERFARYDAHLVEAARLYQLPIEFLRAIVRVESNFNPTVVSRKGAKGLMQLMPSTVRSMGVRDPFDPHDNILGGARLLRILANRWNGDLVLTIASYNAGAGAVTRHRGVPPFQETRQYVRRVMAHYYAYRAGRPLARR